jgi:glycine/D-amino acid oxidase-like deaminating enzyme
LSIENSTSVWAATAGAPAVDCERLAGSARADVVVIGGGFCGLSTALHLAEGGASVRLLEAHSIGYGASGRNGGQANPGLKYGQEALEKRFGAAGRGIFRMGEEAVDFLAALIARKDLKCQFRRPGVIRLAHSETAMRTVREAYEGLVERGIAARLLAADDVAELVGTRRYAGGLLDPRGGNLHPLDLARELARAAREAGARLHDSSRVTSLTRGGHRWKAATRDGEVIADHVVVATNAYTDGLVPGLAASIVPVNSFQIATEPVSEDIGRTILPGNQAVYDSRRLVLYFRKTPEGRVMLGGRASFSSSDDDMRSAADYGVLSRVLHGIFPSLKEIPIAYRWTGLVCLTPDFVPHYHAPAPGMHIALGFNGRGVAMATRTGAWLANRLMGREDTAEIPATGIGRIPFHGLRGPVLDLVMRWNALLDAWGK